MIKIGIDIMGGDFAPLATLEGAADVATKLHSDTHLVLVGDEKIIREKIAIDDYPNLSIFHTDEVIGMHEHPVKALQSKPNSSLAQGFKLLAKQEINAFASAGHSGAVMVGAMNSLKVVEGLLRPCIAIAFALPNGKRNILLDAGINADCKPEVLAQFGTLGSLYSQKVFGVETKV